MADNINDIILRTPHGGTAMLPAGEFEGPVYITKPIRLVGKDTTIWAKRGSVIEVTAQGAAIEDLRVELTEGDVRDTAIAANYPVFVKNVEVQGGVKGFGAEDGFFDVPRTIELGTFAPDTENSFTMTVNVPAPTEIVCGTSGVTISPRRLETGRNEVGISVKGIGDHTVLYAELLFKSQFVRRIYLMGRADGSVSAVSGKCVYTAPERDFSAARSAVVVPETTANAPAMSSEPTTDVISVISPAPLYDMPLLELKMGQRVSLYQYIGTKCEIYFSCSKPSNIDIDPYVFMLDGNERSFGDSGLIFFGNESSERGEVRYFPNDGHVEIDFDKTDYRVQKIALAYSVYAGNYSNNFSLVRAPKISIVANGAERISFTMDRLTDETTAVAMEFYLYNGEWKLSAVGAGYRNGMAKLCNRYGIEVEE